MKTAPLTLFALMVNLSPFNCDLKMLFVIDTLVERITLIKKHTKIKLIAQFQGIIWRTYNEILHAKNLKINDKINNNIADEKKRRAWFLVLFEFQLQLFDNLDVKVYVSKKVAVCNLRSIWNLLPSILFVFSEKGFVLNLKDILYVFLILFLTWSGWGGLIC